MVALPTANDRPATTPASSPPISTTARTRAWGNAVGIRVRTPVPISKPNWRGPSSRGAAMIDCGTAREFCGKCNDRPTSSNGMIATITPTSASSRRLLGIGASKLPRLPASRPDKKPPPRRPMTKKWLRPRQTGELSKSAELRLQTEPEMEYPLEIPMASHNPQGIPRRAVRGLRSCAAMRRTARPPTGTKG